jgi:pilus assembly protein CpaE
MSKITVLLAEQTQRIRRKIRSVLKDDKDVELVDTVRQKNHILDEVDRVRPDILLIDYESSEVDGEDIIDIITSEYPEIVVVVTLVQFDLDVVKKLFSVGARDIIEKSLIDETLSEALVATYKKEERVHQKKGIFKPKTTKKCRVLTLVGNKGGVGRTSLAVNLAVGFATRVSGKVAILDFDLQAGDVSVCFNATPRYTINDLIKRTGDLDIRTIDEYMIAHQTGVKILPAPAKPEYAEYISAAHIEKIVEVLKESYDYLIIDISNHISEVELTCLDLSDRILMLTSGDVATLKNTKLLLEMLRALNYNSTTIRMILNKATEKNGIKYKDIEKTLEEELWGKLPNEERSLIGAINRGIPLAVLNSRNPYIKEVNRLVDKTVAEFDYNVSTRKRKLKKPSMIEAFKKVKH